MSDEVLITFRKIRGILVEMLRSGDAHRESVAEILQLLNEIEPRALSSAATHSKDRSISRTLRYQFEQFRGEPHLCEYRDESPYPFRCSKEIYDAAVSAIETSRDGLKYADIQKAISKTLGKTIPDYPTRTCLRFWTSGDKPILRRSRARYFPLNPAQFREHAAKLWFIGSELRDEKKMAPAAEVRPRRRRTPVAT